MERKCKICGGTRDLFELEYQPNETEANDTYSVYVCGSCWDVIATIARRIAIHEIANEKDKVKNKP